nr:hypothetical protein Iba_chr07cCG3800 [Ipomoea batatas]GMD17409.1 hypothetical protein Iba_chr07dCG3300 [Ipomoea batatas]GMD18858.1 hypothetical protein Iba_chr07eCG3220 [Ipomoea batatas]GMD20283.1 hypothetical protein Iba_chr07fCG3380 [Ipomoea batatas]
MMGNMNLLHCFILGLIRFVLSFTLGMQRKVENFYDLNNNFCCVVHLFRTSYSDLRRGMMGRALLIGPHSPQKLQYN